MFRKLTVLLSISFITLISYGEPIEEIRNGAIYYMKGIVTDSKVEVISVDGKNRKVKVFDLETKETYLVSPSDLVSTSESISRDIDRAEFVFDLLNITIESMTVSNYKLNPRGDNNESYEGYRTCLYNFSNRKVRLQAYFNKYEITDFSGNGKHYKLTKSNVYEIEPNGLLEVKLYSKSYDNIGLAWKRSDMNKYTYSSAGGVMNITNSDCKTYSAWRNSSAIVAGVSNPDQGSDYWPSANNCSFGSDAQKLCVKYMDSLY